MPSLASKLEILGAACAFDISASMPTGEVRVKKSVWGGIPNNVGRNCVLEQAGKSYIYQSACGEQVAPQFKALLSNACAHACKYCFIACERRKLTFTPEEYARVFYKFFQEGRVTGVFISSGILRGDPDYTTHLMLEAVRLIREQYHFAGYVHFKCLPGVSRDLLRQVAPYASRVSVNLEAPSAARLARIADDKDFKQDLLTRQEWIHDLERGGAFPSGQSTQFVVGAAGETDAELLFRVNWANKNVHLRRAYYSAFTPIKGTPLEYLPATPLARVRRLYQADFLMRSYRFPMEELREIFMDDGSLPRGDPKEYLARAFFDHGEVVDVSEAPYGLLIRVPGIGHKSARAIVYRQKHSNPILNLRDLKSLGVVVRKALPFLAIRGQRQESLLSPRSTTRGRL